MSFRNAIPSSIHLSKERQDELTDLADRVVAETLDEYENFVGNHRQMDSRYWKRVKSREKVHVYRTRRASSAQAYSTMCETQPSRPRLLSNNTIEEQQRQAIAAGRPHFTSDEDDDEPQYDKSMQSQYTLSSSSGTGSSTSFPEKSVLHSVKPPNMPLIVAIGIIEGSVEDVAFGALAHTRDTWHERNRYVKNDNFDEREVLASFEGPSEEDPFRFVGIKWASRVIATFASRRDILFLESSGMALDSDGERVYYSLAHSIELDECPELHDEFNIVRLNLSICYIMRQLNDTQIEVYGRGYADMGGNLPAVIGFSVFSQAVVDVVGIVEASYLKKLSWLMGSRRASGAREHSYLSRCHVCGSYTKIFAKIIQTGNACAICRHSICQKCTVQKTLLVDAAQDVQRQFTFCVSCVIHATKLSPWKVAMTQLKLQQQQQ